MRITQYTEDTAPTSDDLIITVNNVAGTPANKKVTIGNLSKALGWVNVRAYGAKGDGITDDTAAIQAAIDSITGGIIFFPKGTYLTSTELLIQNKNSINLKGVGTDVSIIKWKGAATGHMVRFNGCYFGGIEEMELQTLVAKPAKSGICIDYDGSATVATTELIFRKIFINGNAAAAPYGFTNGIHILGATNCDAIIYDGIRISSCDRAWYSEGGQSRLNLFLNPVLMYNGYAIYWGAGGYGPFTMIEPYFYGSDSYDIYVGDVGTDSINIIGGRSEGCDRFLYTSSTSFPFPVNIQGMAIATDALNVDGVLINYQSMGNLNLIGCRFGLAAAQSIPTIFLNWPAANIVGCAFRRNDNTSPVTTGGPAFYNMENCSYLKADGSHAYLSDIKYKALTALANDATPSVLGSDKWLTGGVTTITDFDDGYEGQILTIISEHAITITDGTNIFLNASGNWTMAATDTLTLICKADNKWYELSRSDNT